MNEMYYLGIQGKQVGPLNEDAIAQRIQEGIITRHTLAWCHGMDNWKPVQEIPELMNAVGPLLAAQVQPPPLPEGQARTVPPPLTGAQVDRPTEKGGKAQGLSSLNEQAYRFVAWCYRPWRGRSSPLRTYVDKDPEKRALPVAVGTLVMIVLILILAISSLTPTEDRGSGTQPNLQAGQQPSQAPPDGAWREQHRALMVAQRYGQDISQRVYENRRASEDRRDETYRRGTYDWYRP